MATRTAAISVPSYAPGVDYGAFSRYIELVNSGVPPFEALRQAFPEGMQSPQQRAEKQAKAEQSGALGQLGGMTVGLIGAKALQDAMAGERVLGGLRDTVSGIGSKLTGSLGGGGAATEVAPQILDPRDAAGFVGAGQGEPGFLDSVNLGALGEGALGAFQAYQGHKQFQGGDKIGGGLGMAGGAARIGGALGSQTLGKVAGPIGAAYGAYTLGRMGLKGGDYTSADTKNLAMQGAAAGASIGSVVPGVGTAIGATIGAALGGITGLTGSKKGRQQVIRDKWRDAMLSNNSGLFDANYQGTLADGSTYDWGKEGKGRFKFDYNKPTVGKAAAYGNVLAAIQGATGKAGEAIATQYLGAATSNAGDDLSKVQDNYKSFLGRMGIDQATGQAQLDRLRQEGKLDEQRYQVYTNDLRELAQPSVPPRQQSQRRR